jgi:hypothetical protein
MPILTCGGETWTSAKADISRLMAAGMRFVRIIEGNAKRE